VPEPLCDVFQFLNVCPDQVGIVDDKVNAVPAVLV
jgi:hypothetical protein